MSKLEIPVDILGAADEIVRLGKGKCHGSSYFANEALVAKILYARSLGTPGKRVPAEFAGIRPDHFRKIIGRLEKAEPEELQDYEAKFLEYWNEFGASPKMAAMEALKRNSIASDKPSDQIKFLELSDRGAFSQKPAPNIGKQINIQNNDNRVINQIQNTRDIGELMDMMKQIEAELPAEMLEDMRRVTEGEIEDASPQLPDQPIANDQGTTYELPNG